MRDLTATVSSYFVVNTASDEKEAERVANTIHDSIFDVNNLARVDFLNNSGKYIGRGIFSAGPFDLHHFSCCSIVHAHHVVHHAPNHSILLELSLHLSQTTFPFISTTPFINLTITT